MQIFHKDVVQFFYPKEEDRKVPEYDLLMGAAQELDEYFSNVSLKSQELIKDLNNFMESVSGGPTDIGWSVHPCDGIVVYEIRKNMGRAFGLRNQFMKLFQFYTKKEFSTVYRNLFYRVNA